MVKATSCCRDLVLNGKKPNTVSEETIGGLS